MGPEFFGDSYDVVKREIICGLAPAEHWVVHPMYFDAEPEPNFAARYAEFLGIDVVKGNILERRCVTATGQACQNHLLLDPDTGLKVRRIGGNIQEGAGSRTDEYISFREMRDIARADGRQRRLTLVYDQSYSRNLTLGLRRQRAQEKLAALRNHDVALFGAAYISHAVFIWVSACRHTVRAATNRLISCSGLPVCRFVGVGAGHHLPEPGP